MSVDPQQDIQQSGAAPPAPPPPADSPNPKMVTGINVLGALLRGDKIRGEDLQIPKETMDVLGGLIGGVVDESQIGGYIADNHEAVRDAIISKIYDPAVPPEKNFLVKVITGLDTERLDSVLRDNPELMDVVSGILQEQLSPEKLVVSDVLDQMGIPVEGLDSVAALKLSELTPAALASVPDQTILDMAAYLPDVPGSSTGEDVAPPGGFAAVVAGFNAELSEANLPLIEVPADADTDTKQQLLNGAVETLAQNAYAGSDSSSVSSWLKRQWMAVTRDDLKIGSTEEEYMAAYKEEVLARAADAIREQAPSAIVEATQNVEISAKSIQDFVSSRPDAVMAGLRQEENKQKLTDALTMQLLVDNADLVKPYAGDFMQGGIADLLAGYVNQILDHPMFAGLFEGLKEVFGQFGFGDLGNMFADLGLGGNTPRNGYGEPLNTPPVSVADAQTPAPAEPERELAIATMPGPR